MPKIHFVFPDSTEARFALEGDVFTVGRAEDNDIVIPDPRVSSHHLTLKRSQSGNYLIHDLGATNPTRVNGRPSSLAELADGDTLMLGDTYARYEAPAAVGSAQPRSFARPARAPTSESGPAPSGCFALVVAVGIIGAVCGTAWATW